MFYCLILDPFVGEKLLEDDSGTLTVAKVSFNPDAPINVTYNLDVADFHTYFVGEDGVLVHNGNAPYSFGDLRRAYEEACKLIGGCKGLPKFIGKFGSPSRGDSTCGIRLYPPDSHGKKWHINYWDFRNGKRGRGGIAGAITIILKK